MAQEDYQQCQNICVNPGGWVSDPCCEPECCLSRIGITTPILNDSYDVNIDPLRISYSFLLSVDHDIGWQPVVNQSVQRCYDQIENTPVDYEQMDCPGIPSVLERIIDCCYKENYLRCPRWNQQNKNCIYAYKSVKNDC